VIAPGYHGHAIARSLGRLGVPVYGVHADRRSPSARSRYWRGNYFWNLAEAPPSASVNWLLQLGCTLGERPVLMPTDDASCVFLADNAAVLGEAFRFPTQPPGLARKLSSKKMMYALAQKHGIPAAATLFPSNRDDVVDFAKRVQFPVLLKGIDTIALQQRFGVKMVLAEDPESMVRLYDAMETPNSPNLMVQEYLGGGSRTVWMFNGYFDGESRCRFGLTATMIRQYPAYTGRTSLGVCRTNPIVAEQARRFMEAVGYRGPLDIGFKHDARSGAYKVIDVNPRIGATFRLLVDTAGMDVARATYLDLTGQPIETGKIREGRKWVVENFDLLSSPTYCRSENLSPWDWLRSYAGVEEGEWFALDDPGPFVAMVARSLAMPGRWLPSRLTKGLSGCLPIGG
jgi:predicted ATP-grasp superfamily ATP-dependent carboligase